MNTAIGIEMGSAGLTARQQQHIELIVKHPIKQGIGNQTNLTAGRQRSLIAQTGRGYFNPSPAQQINQGDCFQLFTPFSQRNKHTGHIALLTNDSG
jgi:hypothetical protein